MKRVVSGLTLILSLSCGKVDPQMQERSRDVTKSLPSNKGHFEIVLSQPRWGNGTPERVYFDFDNHLMLVDYSNDGSLDVIKLIKPDTLKLQSEYSKPSNVERIIPLSLAYQMSKDE